MYAYNNLPETQTDLGRANKWAAACYLMKNIFYEENFQMHCLFNTILVNGKTTAGHPYKLNAHFADNFNPADRNRMNLFRRRNDVNEAQGANSNQGDGLNFPYGGQNRLRWILQAIIQSCKCILK